MIPMSFKVCSQFWEALEGRQFAVHFAPPDRPEGGIPLSLAVQQASDHLLDAFRAYYDIQPVEDGTPLRAICAYHIRDSQYVLVKKAELWVAENHEYLYLWALDTLDEAGVETIFQRVLADGEPRVKPHSQHMYTYLTAVALYDSASPQALAQLKRLKKRREYKLSLHGWMEFRIAAMDLSTGEITTNRAGKSFGKDLKRLAERAIPKQK